MNSTPLSSESALREAIAHHQAGRLKEAAQLYRAILQMLPQHPQANHNLGTLAVQMKQVAAALPHFQAALKANPSEAQYWLSYIDALIRVGQMDAARQVLMQGQQRGLQGASVAALVARLNAVAEDGPGIETVKALEVLFNQKRYAEGEVLARDLTERFPSHGFGWKALGALLREQGRLTEALEPMNKATELLPEDANAHANLGKLLLDQGRFDEAATYFRRAIQIKPDFAEARDNLARALLGWGNVLHDLGQFSEAESCYRRALGIRPEYADAFNNLGLNLQSQERCTEAETSFIKALEINPDYAEAHSNLGGALLKRSRFPEAQASLQQAITLNPMLLEAYCNLGIAFHEQSQYAEAETCCRQALEIKPDYAEAHNNLGLALQKQGHVNDAEVCFQRALEIKPEFAGAYSNLANVLNELGRLEQAIVACEQAIQYQPNLAQAYMNMGYTFQFMDRPNDELLAFQKVLDLDPGNLGLEIAVWLAIRHYLAGDYEQFQNMLIAAHPLVAINDDKYKSPRIYWRYLSLIFSWRQKSDLWPPRQGMMPLLYVIGESHSLSAHGVVVRYRDQEMCCDAQWISGCKQWHLGNDKANKYKRKFEAVMARLPRQSNVLLIIGEIDCRPDEGIMKVWGKHPNRTLDDIVQATVGSYVRYVGELATRYQHHLIVCGVPATNNLEGLTEDMVGQLVAIIRIFNATLKEMVLVAGMSFLDVYALTDRGDGIASGEWHIDSNHLLPSAVEHAFANYCVGRVGMALRVLKERGQGQ